MKLGICHSKKKERKGKCIFEGRSIKLLKKFNSDYKIILGRLLIRNFDMGFSIPCLICIQAQQGGVPKIGIKIKSLPVELSLSERHVFGKEIYPLELI